MTDRTPLYVAIIALIGAGVGVIYNTILDSKKSPCVTAREWIGDESPNPYISELDRARMSSAMVKKAMECAR